MNYRGIVFNGFYRLEILLAVMSVLHAITIKVIELVVLGGFPSQDDVGWAKTVDNEI